MKTDIVEELSVVEHTEMYEVNPDLTELNEIIYATSTVLQSKCGINPISPRGGADSTTTLVFYS